MSNEAILAVPPTTTLLPYKLYRQRFYVLAVFALLTFNQSVIWITFSPIARSAESYYKIDDATIDLFLNWGPITFIPCLPLSYILLNKQHGLRRSITLLAVLGFVAALIRVIPLVITSPSSPHFNAITIPFLHVGQILNALSGPVSTIPVSQLSCLWFGANERTRATSVAIFAHKLGGAIAFLTSSAIVPSPEYIPRLLFIHLGLAFVGCILVLLYFPVQPPTPPSHAAELLMCRSSKTTNPSAWRTSLKNIWQCLITPSFVLLSLAGGLAVGAFAAWTSLFDTLLKPENYTERQAAWFGFGALVSAILGGLSISTLADTHYFQRRFKLLIVVALTGYFLSILWFQLSVHTIFYDKPILHSTPLTMGLSVCLAGFFQGAFLPIVFESIAEIMFPLPASLSASILLQCLNITVLIFLFIAPNREKLVNLLVLIILATCFIMSCLARFTYKRRDADERKQLSNGDTINTYSGEIIHRSSNASVS